MPETIHYEFPARVGRNYKVVLAIILPCLLIVPFIYFLQCNRIEAEWNLWAVIIVFLALVIALSLWLALRSYPRAVICIQQNTIKIQFKKPAIFSHNNISINFSDIISFTSKLLGGDEYFVMRTKDPKRTLQFSPSSNNENELLAFERGMQQIAEKLPVNI